MICKHAPFAALKMQRFEIGCYLSRVLDARHPIYDLAKLRSAAGDGGEATIDAYRRGSLSSDCNRNSGSSKRAPVLNRQSAQMVGLLETVNRCGNAFHS